MSRPTAIALNLLLIWGVQARLAQSSARAQAASDLVLPASFEQRKIRRLTLEETLRIAVQNNLNIHLQREQTRQGEANLRISRSFLEPQLGTTLNYSDSISPPATTLEGRAGETFQSRSHSWTTTLSQKLISGTSLGLDYSGSRNRSGSRGAVEPLLYRGTLAFELTQPLLRGFSLDLSVPKAPILEAEVADGKNLVELRNVVAREVRRTEDAYWKLAEAAYGFGVTQAALELAQDQLRLAQKQIQAGILAPTELVGSESSLAERELAMVQAEAELETAMDELRYALNLPKEQRQDVLLAIDQPTMNAQRLSFDEALRDAMQRRAEVQQYRLDRQLAELREQVTDNNRLPELNLTLRYGLAGQDSGYNGTLSQLRGLDAPRWSAFVNFNWAPLGREASAKRQLLRSQNRSRQLEYERFLNDLHKQIRAALRRLEAARRRVTASQKFHSLAARSLEAERKRFLSGKSRSLDVSRRQDELARARMAEISARIAFMQASGELDLATGSLLERRRIRLRQRSRGPASG